MRTCDKSGTYAVLVATMLISTTGCGGPANPPYPTGGAVTNETPPGPPAMSVPPDAVPLAQAKYPLVSFAAPTEPGLIYVYDVTTSTVVAKTSLGSDTAGKTLTMVDLKNVTRDLDTSHEFKISFVPYRHMMQTTMPSGSQ